MEKIRTRLIDTKEIYTIKSQDCFDEIILIEKIYRQTIGGREREIMVPSFKIGVKECYEEISGENLFSILFNYLDERRKGRIG